MSMFGPKPGSWWLMSKSDPKWKATGHVEALSVTQMPLDAQKALDELRKKYGNEPPDLEYGCMKD